MDLDVLRDDADTGVGSYFVANYPPFSVWSPDHVPTALAALDSSPPDPQTPLGLYLHIPFCRKRCKFCYFRVYTEKNSSDVETYLNALAQEIALYADLAAFAGREFEFVYFGGGTPSFLSSQQLERLVERIGQHWRWDSAREVTFECEPGTLKKSKLEVIKKIGTTRLSLGVEHFDDDVLSVNGRAHKSPEILRSYEWAREVDFQQINIDLIAGMVSDTESKWKETVDKAIAMAPDSVTIYQMELPYNTVIAKESLETGVASPVASWATKRAWVAYAFEQFEREGYVISSAYTLLNPKRCDGFVYRDAIWHGADMVGTGVASFSHVSNVHFQNVDSWDEYVGEIGAGRLPISRAYPVNDEQRLIRELVLQLKLGRLDAAYFRGKFGVEITEQFGDAFDGLASRGFAKVESDCISLTQSGLLRIDALLPAFFEPEHRDIRYT